MRLLLVRHGHAQGWGRDPALSDQGVAAVCAMLTTSWPAPGLVVHSPLLRTVQTAALLADHWPAADAIEDPAFVPEASPDAAARRLLHHAAGRATVALVAHLPLLPALHRWFTGADRDFVPAGAVLLEAADDVAWRGAFSVIPEGET